MSGRSGAVQNGLVLVTQTRSLIAEGPTLFTLLALLTFYQWVHQRLHPRG